MPSRSGFTRPKKAKKGSGEKSTTTSVVSRNSRSMSQGSVTADEKSNGITKDEAHAQAIESNNTHPLETRFMETQTKMPDVFDFLENGESDDPTSSEDEDDQIQATSEKPPTTVTHERSISDASRVSRSQNKSEWHPLSDIASRRSSAVSKESQDNRSRIHVDASPAATRAQLQLAEDNTTGEMTPMELPPAKSVPKQDWSLSLPEAYYSPEAAPSIYRTPLPPSPPRSPEEESYHGHRRLSKSTRLSHAPTGYGLLASHLSASDSPNHAPLYRRFDNLNHRVLLHLQDEIAQMEEELLALDEYEEEHRAATAEHEGTKIVPASRRVEAEAQAYSALHYRRQDLLGVLAQKTEQYNNALAAYTKIQTLPRASETDLNDYRIWMKDTTPIAAAETRFLDHSHDLIALSQSSRQQQQPPPPPSSSSSSAVTTPVYSTIVIASTAILLPLLAFSMISEFAGRLIVVTVVGGAAAAIAANYSTGAPAERLVDSRDGWRCATLYFGFMTIAAMFIA